MHFASCCIFDNEAKSLGTRSDPANTSSRILDACLTDLGFGVAAVGVVVPFVAGAAARPTAAAACQGAPRPRATVVLKENDSDSIFFGFFCRIAPLRLRKCTARPNPRPRGCRSRWRGRRCPGAARGPVGRRWRPQSWRGSPPPGPCPAAGRRRRRRS